MGPAEDSDCAIFDSCDEEPAPAPPAPECDPIFDECEEKIEVETRSDCFDSINEIDSLDNDGRNVFNDCNGDLKCSDYASEGYSCANAWNCNDNNTIITDGKGLIDARSASDFTLDLSDSKCDVEDQIC